MNAPRLPPHNLDAEGAVLSACLLSQEATDEVVTLLGPEDFFADANRRIFGAIGELAREGKNPDIVAVAELLRGANRLAQVGGTPYLAQICDTTPAISNIGEHCRIVAELARVRRAQNVCHRFAAEAYGDVGPVREWLATVEHEIYQATASHGEERETVGMYGDIARETFDDVYRWASGPGALGTPMGFAALDRHVGGCVGGDLWYIAGRPGMGKTAFVKQVLVNIVEPLTAVGDDLFRENGAVMFSMEMSRQQLMLRAIAQRANIRIRELRSGNLSKQQWDAFSAAVAEFDSLPIIIDDAEALTPAKLRGKLRRHIATLRARFPRMKRVAAVGVDYVQLMLADVATKQTRNEQIEEISRSLKGLAKTFDTTVLALSQLNRPDKRLTKVPRPGLTDLRDSGALEQDADVVLFIHREDEYRAPAERTGDAELIVGKGRNCGTDIHYCKFDGPHTRFYEEHTELPYQETA